jgi:hypothetical protein
MALQDFDDGIAIRKIFNLEGDLLDPCPVGTRDARKHLELRALHVDFEEIDHATQFSGVDDVRQALETHGHGHRLAHHPKQDSLREQRRERARKTIAHKPRVGGVECAGNIGCDALQALLGEIRVARRPHGKVRVVLEDDVGGRIGEPHIHCLDREAPAAASKNFAVFALGRRRRIGGEDGMR